jgi:D-alanyl-lipoteichoic acid acyltransferase DltB (MBOAT superfamily)
MHSIKFIELTAVYLVASSLALKIPNRSIRDFVFCLINLVAVLLPFRINEVSLQSSCLITGTYLLLALFQYLLTGLLARTSSIGAWISILFPISALITLRGFGLGVTSIKGLPDASVSVVITCGFSYLAFRLSLSALEFAANPALKASLWEYLGFVFFVPLIPVGPINSYQRYLKSYSQARPFSLGIVGPLERIVVGATKYLFFGSVLYRVSFPIQTDVHNYLIDVVVASVAYYLYLFCNFSGFCDFAIGGAAMMGIELEENFQSPFISRNVTEFWSRWHITLMNYLRNLIFNPTSKWLVGNLGNFASTVGIYCLTIIVFIVVGFWHGNKANYILFGLYHGLGVVGHHIYSRALASWLTPNQLASYRRNKFIHVLCIAATFAFVSASYFLFANDLRTMKSIITSMR